MKLKNVRHVFFDLDHTLWNFDKNSALTFEKIFQINKIEINLDNFLKIYEPINLQYWKLYREEKIDKASLRFKRLDDAFKIMKIEVKTSMIYKLSKDYITYLTTYSHLFEDAIEILNYLKPKYSIHIITNGFKEAQQAKLINSNIATYFKTVTNSEMVGVKKPNPKIFSHALKMARAKAEHSIMIGDSYEADVLGALNSNIDAIFFNIRNEEVNSSIIQINRLKSLKNYL